MSEYNYTPDSPAQTVLGKKNKSNMVLYLEYRQERYISIVYVLIKQTSASICF